LSFFNEVDGDNDVADGTITRDGAVKQDRFIQCDVFSIFYIGLRQVIYDEVVTLSPGMLEIGNGIDPAGCGCLPQRSGHLLDDFQYLPTENLVVFRCDDHEDIFILEVGFLDRFQLQQLRIVLAEEHPEVAVDGEPGQAHAAKQEQHDRYRDDEPAMCQGADYQRRGEVRHLVIIYAEER